LDDPERYYPSKYAALKETAVARIKIRGRLSEGSRPSGREQQRPEAKYVLRFDDLTYDWKFDEL